MKFYTHSLIAASLFFAACGDTTETTTETTDTTTVETSDLGANPAAEGFDEAGSDPEAIAIADSVMVHHGGRKAYDDARYISWNFFGARSLVWDKEEDHWTGRPRAEGERRRRRRGKARQTRTGHRGSTSQPHPHHALMTALLLLQAVVR